MNLNKKKLCNYIKSDINQYRKREALSLKADDVETAIKFNCMRKAAQKTLDEVESGIYVAKVVDGKLELLWIIK